MLPRAFPRCFFGSWKRVKTGLDCLREQNLSKDWLFLDPSGIILVIIPIWEIYSFILHLLLLRVIKLENKSWKQPFHMCSISLLNNNTISYIDISFSYKLPHKLFSFILIVLKSRLSIYTCTLKEQWVSVCKKSPPWTAKISVLS